MKRTQVNVPEMYLNEGLIEVAGGLQETQQADNAAAYVNSYVSTFGRECARGMLQRAGRAGLYYWLRDHAENYGWQLPEFRLLSFRQKVKKGINDIAGWFEQAACGKFAVDAHADKMVIRFTNERSFSQMDCAFYLGLFQEFLSWSASGKFFPAAEVQCAPGEQGTHIFEIALNPLD